MKVHNVKGRLALVTGGSSGIGYAIAEALAKQGFNLLLVARNKNKLQTAATELAKQYKVNTHIASIDVTNVEAVNQLASLVRNIAPCADLVVNSAGIVSGGFLIDTPLEEWDRLYQFNVRGLVSVLQNLLPDMEKQYQLDGQERHIVNIASAAAYLCPNGMAAYSSTKAGVISLSEVLAHELSSQKIGVTVVCPEFVKTPIGEKVQLFGRFDTPRAHKVIKKMFEKSTITPEQLAVKTLKAIEKNKTLIAAGKQATFAYHFKRLMPDRFFNLIESKFAFIKN